MACKKCGREGHASANYCPWEGKTIKSFKVSKHYEGEKRKQKELDLYAQARKEGSQPWGTRSEQNAKDAGDKLRSVEHALRESDRLGRPYNARDLGATYHPEISKAIKELTPEQKERARAVAVGG